MLDTCVSESKETIVIGDLNVNYSKNSDNTETNHNEVKIILRKLNKKKSSGYDEIPIPLLLMVRQKLPFH